MIPLFDFFPSKHTLWLERKEAIREGKKEENLQKAYMGAGCHLCRVNVTLYAAGNTSSVRPITHTCGEERWNGLLI